MRTFVVRTATIAGAIVAAACVYDAPVTPDGNTLTAANVANSPTVQLNNGKSYIIDFVGKQLPSDLAAQVAKAGGTLTGTMDEVGVATATSADPSFGDRAVRIGGVFSVLLDPMVQWVQPEQFVEAGESDVGPGGDVTVAPNASFGAAEPLRRAQWVPDQISAPAAWDAGARGAGVRVAILDGGMRDVHPDIAPELDVARSRSFVPDTAHPGTFRPFNTDSAARLRADGVVVCDVPDGLWHATHVAGIVAAPGNNTGTVGIAPSATIISVKVLHCGDGSFSWLLNGILYASAPIAAGGAGADIINMSLGAEFEHQAHDTTGKVLRDTLTGKVIHTARFAALLQRVIGKVTTLAYQRGVTIVASLGNSGLDLDHTNDLLSLPAMAPHVIAVSATGPFRYAFGATNFDRPASYTNFGQSAVTLAAGGGDFAYFFVDRNSLCAVPRNPSGLVVSNCWAFDEVLAPCRGAPTVVGSYCFAAGTSMAAPAVAGVAALIIGKFGRIGPAAVEQRLRQSADDLGKPGNDDFYGGGRVNALRAIQ
jgi:lantibiotic leader peptide-processing serine protease